VRRSAGRRLLALALLILADAAPPPPEPSGYRLDDYRAPTPASLHGATVLSTDTAHALWAAGKAAFIDVLPRPPRPAGLPPGTIWRPKPRADIPGSAWLPDTGYGVLAPVMADYFARGLRDATGGDRDRTVVFYCLANCWMSWNAAKRALSLGYSHVDWYPEGTDGWARAGLPLQARQPMTQPQAAE
jgi:PQQ-dependent catabolism-associated CXXCW motif protein